MKYIIIALICIGVGVLSAYFDKKLTEYDTKKVKKVKERKMKHD